MAESIVDLSIGIANPVNAGGRDARLSDRNARGRRDTGVMNYLRDKRIQGELGIILALR